MKISFEAKRLFNNFTGLGNYARTLVANLQEAYPEHSYTLYTPRLRERSETNSFLDEARFRVVVPRCKRLASLWRSWGVIANIRRDEVQIYHGLSHDLPFSVSAGRHATTKYVVTIHDLCYRTFPEMFAPIERLIYRFKYSHSLRVADAVVAISESTRRDTLRYFPDVDPAKVVTIYQTLNPLYYTPMDRGEAVSRVKELGIEGEYMLYVGSINSRKNLLGVVRAYAMIEPQKRLPLVIVGSGGAYKEQVLEFAKANNLLGDLHLLSSVHETTALQALYTASVALIYPSFYEGFGLPVAEALLCGVPVITSTVSSLPEAAGEGAIYVDPHSDEQIARAIERLSEDRAYAAQLAERGRAYVVDRFDVERLTSQMNELYKSLVE